MKSMYYDLIALIIFSDVFNFSNLIYIKIRSSCLSFLSIPSSINKSIALLSISNKFSKSISLFLLNFSILLIFSDVFSLNIISSLILKPLPQFFFLILIIIYPFLFLI